MSLRFLLSILAAAASSHAFIIDSSCNAYTDLLRPAIQQAFANANDAHIALTATPRDPSVDRLARLLFGEPGPAGPTQHLAQMLRNLNGLRDAVTEITGTPPLVATEVIFYCNIDRLQRRSDGMWVDQNTGLAVEEKLDHPIALCSRGDIKSRVTLAHTWIPHRDEPKDGSGNPEDSFDFPSEITFCPWFLEWAKGKRYRTWKDVSAKTHLARAVIPLLTGKLGAYTQIDALSLLDKVVLHELTHTAAGGLSHDVETDKGFFKMAYGWNQCLELARQTTNTFKISARNNADSIALFASAVQLLRNNPPLYISDDGLVSTKQPTKRYINETMATASGVPSTAGGMEQDAILTRPWAKTMPHMGQMTEVQT